MHNVEMLYNENKLLVRAMDWPKLSKNIDGLYYDCTTWSNEFCFLMNGILSSASSTLIIPNVGVKTYKNIGFLINSDLANCFHISKTDSCSNGNMNNSDFHASNPDFSTIDQLANYIKNNNDTNMNEVNINTSINSVVGLFINECPEQYRLLQMIFIVKKCLFNLTNIDYPIYLYNAQKGNIKKIELSFEDEQEIINTLKTTQIFYWPDEYNEPIVDDINNMKSKRK